MQTELLPHLFRTEFSRIVAVLCSHFGLEHMEAAEDIASETFLAACESWTYKAVPENPEAWLYSVAKNKAKNYLKRNHLFESKIKGDIKRSSRESEEIEIDLSDKHIRDSQLQMLFTICHHSISVEAQIGLSLRILCGFGINEIANAFLTTKDTINKRLLRAKEKLRKENVSIEFPDANRIDERLQSVLRTLYLLFNEGYYSESRDEVVRDELCLEAMRLTYLLTENKLTCQPAVHALLSLMCFHASRFAARKNDRGEIILFQNQDETLWNQELITKGIHHLNLSRQGNELSKYHLEAGIAWWHTLKEDTMEKWENILQLYNLLLQIEYSPVIALNRTFALSKVRGAAKVISEAEKLDLKNNHFYFILLGELYKEIDREKSKLHFQKAQAMATTTTDKQTIQVKLDVLEKEENVDYYDR
jgi:RNA polymerase sigma factor (sigma-70 family)